MTIPDDQSTMFTIRLSLQNDFKNSFHNWQAKLNSIVSALPGFVSLETSLAEDSQRDWLIVQRFQHATDLTAWRNSKEYQELLLELQEYVQKNSIQEILSDVSKIMSGVTEVFVTEVSPAKEKEFLKWTAKIHNAEARFPGFKGTYIQAPSPGTGKNWITMLQFDTPKHLDIWLSSYERKMVLEEGKSLIASLEDHRVISPYAGWFTSVIKEGKAPAAWKQGTLVLLVLFPIVMLEILFLNPHLKSLNPSLGTFIGNAISVALVTFPLMPIAIHYFRWWLAPSLDKTNSGFKTSLKGILIILAFFIIEVVVFWQFFKNVH